MDPARLDPLPKNWPVACEHRDAAVLVAWRPGAAAGTLLFTRRRDDLPHHAGQMSFPGGVREGDEDPVACALREAEEEVGLAPAACRPLGALAARTSPFGFRVLPIVAAIAADVALRIDPREVARLVEIPLAELCRSDRWSWRPHATQRPPSPHFEFAGEVVWGLTARMTLDLVGRISPTP